MILRDGRVAACVRRVLGCPAAATFAAASLLLVAGCATARQPADREAASPAHPLDVDEYVQEMDRERHTLEVGFVASYVGQLPNYESVLPRVARDGFRYIRVFELFMHGDRTRDRLAENVALIPEHGLVPYLTWSNFPRELRPTAAERERGEWRYDPQKRSDILSYSNRYPPSDLGAYRRAVREALARLAEGRGRDELASWMFEVGAEPNAARFFWGHPEDYPPIFASTVQAIRQIDSTLTVGGPGFSSGAFRAGEDERPLSEWSRGVVAEHELDFFSFHLYSEDFDSGEGMRDAVSSFLPSAPKVVLSEWNVSSWPDAETQKTLQSSRFMAPLLDVLWTCYHSRVDILLAFKLMDRPGSAASPQLGFFDAEGEPKRAYDLLALVVPALRDGYSISKEGDLMVFHSDTLTIFRAMGERRHLDITGSRMLDGSEGIAIRDSVLELGPGNWVALRGPIGPNRRGTGGDTSMSPSQERRGG